MRNTIIKHIFWYCFTFTLLSVNALAQTEQATAIRIPIYLPSNSTFDNKSIKQLNLDFGETYEFKLTKYQRNYQQAIKSGTFGVYFASPHFAAWLIHQHDFQPVLTLNESLSYVIAARRDDVRIFELSDLSKMNICLQAPLNLDYLFYKTTFASFISAPHAYTVQNAALELQTNNPACDAFVVNNHSYIRTKKSNPDLLIKLEQSPSFTNYSFVAHPSINPQQVSHLTSILIDKKSHLNALFHTVTTRPKLIKAKMDNFPKYYLDELKSYWPLPLSKSKQTSNIK